MANTTKRFSDRSKNYVKYRPSYPEEALDWIISKSNDPKNEIFADIGSGTGIFSKLLASNVKSVYGVEPNLEMRLAAEDGLKEVLNFISVDGAAEQTNLLDGSIDHITVAQAFHWFDMEKSMSEFKRILKANGSVFLIWNIRQTNPEFMLLYEKLLLQSSGDYKKVSQENKVDFNALPNYISKEFEIKRFYFEKEYSWSEFKGRHNSSAYAPKASSQENKDLLNQLKAVFEKHAQNGKLAYFFETKVYHGKFS